MTKQEQKHNVENQRKDNVHTSSYTTDLGYITLETKSVVVQ